MTLRQIFVLMFAAACLFGWAAWCGLFTDAAFECYRAGLNSFLVGFFCEPATDGVTKGWRLPALVAGAMSRLLLELLKWVGLPVAILIATCRGLAAGAAK